MEIRVGTYINLVAIACLSFLITSCSRKDSEIEQLSRQLTFNASMEAPETKAVLDSTGRHVLWSGHDIISVFSGKASGKFISTSGVVTSTASFVGELNGETSADFWAVYPYREDNAFEKQSVIVTVPDSQVATLESFDPDAFVTMAYSENNSLGFKNLCGGVAISVSSHQKRINRIVLKGNNGEVIAGRIEAEFDENGIPKVKSVVEGKQSIELTVSGGGYFTPGKWYYIAAIPQDLPDGYTVEFYSRAGDGFEKRYTKGVRIKRACWGMISEADVSADLVPFTDSRFEQFCYSKLSLYDLDGDNLISIEEASNAEYVSCSYYGISSLADVVYFNNINTLSCNSNNLTELEIRAFPNLVSVNCNSNHITNLELVNNPGLTNVECRNNEIISINLEGCSSLTHLWCQNNNLKVLDVSGFSNLIYLDCTNNPELTELWVAPDQSYSNYVYDESVTKLVFADVTSISLDKEKLVIIKGRQYRLKAHIEPSYYSDRTILWSSSNPSVASVSTDGVITALAEGETVITASTGNRTANCTVRVRDIDADDQGDLSFEDWEEGFEIVF